MREPHYLRDIFSRQAAKIAKTCIPCAALAFFAPLREKKSCERYYFLAGVFSRQAAKVAKTYIIPFRCSSEEAEEVDERQEERRLPRLRAAPDGIEMVAACPVKERMQKGPVVILMILVGCKNSRNQC